MSVLAEFSISPLDKGESVGEYVARCVQVVEDSGLSFEVNPMGTTIEGNTLRECLNVVEACHKTLAKDCNRITCSIRVDTREGPTGRIREKVTSVEEQLGHEVTR